MMGPTYTGHRGGFDRRGPGGMVSLNSGPRILESYLYLGPGGIFKVCIDGSLGITAMGLEIINVSGVTDRVNVQRTFKKLTAC